MAEVIVDSDGTVVAVISDPTSRAVVSTAADTVAIRPPSPAEVTATAPGPPGPAGPPGPSANLLALPAGVDLSGHRAVTTADDGTLVYADNQTPAHVDRAVWLTTAAAFRGTDAQVLDVGWVTEPSWSWIPGNSIWLGSAGQLTQTIPTVPALFARHLGVAITATTVFFDPMPPIALA